MQQRRYHAAYSAFKKAAAQAPHVSGYLYGAASSALYAQDYKGAVRYASELIKLQPKNSAAYHVRMLAYGRLYMLKLHLKDARKVASLNPNDAEARDDLGIALANNRKYYQALAQFTRAIQLQPKNYRYYSNRALVENVIKQRKEAIADIRKALSLTNDPGLKKVLTDELTTLLKQS
jgi:Flp pilus assembly protein TadD